MDKRSFGVSAKVYRFMMSLHFIYRCGEERVYRMIGGGGGVPPGGGVYGVYMHPPKNFKGKTNP